MAELKRNHISRLKHLNMDILLCCHGYGKPYLEGMGWQYKAELKDMNVNSPEYWKKVCDRKRLSKPAAAFKAIMEMSGKGPFAVPEELLDILNRATALGGHEPAIIDINTGINVDKLNAKQQQAVEWGEGPLLVLAGPGSGKRPS